MAITRAQIPRQLELEPGLGSRYNRKKVPVYNSGGTMLKGKQKGCLIKTEMVKSLEKISR